jgi:hypothetical protein
MQAALEPQSRRATRTDRPAAKRGFRRTRARLSTLRDLSRHFSGTGRWWLMPMVSILLIAALLLIVIGIIEYAAPFVYTLF